MRCRFGAAAALVALFAAFSVVPAGASDRTSTSALRVEEQTLDLGKIIAGRSVSAIYTFHNDGATKIRLLNAKPSCGCTVAEFDPVIDPGGSGTLRAVIKTSPHQNGKLSKSIHLQTDADGARNLLLRFTVETYQPIIAAPRTPLVITALEGTSTKAGLLLRREDGAPLEIYSVATDRPGIRATVAAAEKKGNRPGAGTADGELWFEIETADDLPVGVTKGEVRLATNHPDLADLTIPYTLRVRSIIEVRPTVVRLWPEATAGSGGRTALIGLSRVDDREFTVTDVLVSHPKVFTASANSSTDGRHQRIRVKLNDEISQGDFVGSLDGWIRVLTTDPEKPEVGVPVIVAPSRQLTRRAPRLTPSPSVPSSD